MPIVLHVRDRQDINYSPRAEPKWRLVTRKGTRYQDEGSGEVFELFRIKTMAEALDRSVETIRDWEKAGFLLPPLFRIEGHFCKRWYSGVQCVNVNRVMRGKYQGRKYLHDKELLKQFFEDIKAVWYVRHIINVEGAEAHVR